MPPKKIRISKKAVAIVDAVKKDIMTKAKVQAIAKQAVMKTAETKKHSLERIERTLNTLSGFEDQSLISTGQGTTYSERIGHKIQPVGVEVRGHINNNSSVACIARMLIVRFKNDAADPTSDLLETNAGDMGVSTLDVSALWRRVNKDAYTVLSDTTIRLDPAKNSFRTFRKWIPIKKVLNYDSATFAEPSHDKVHLMCFVRGTGNDGVSADTELHYVSTFYYKDV